MPTQAQLHIYAFIELQYSIRSQDAINAFCKSGKWINARTGSRGIYGRLVRYKYEAFGLNGVNEGGCRILLHIRISPGL